VKDEEEEIHPDIWCKDDQSGNKMSRKRNNGKKQQKNIRWYLLHNSEYPSIYCSTQVLTNLFKPEYYTRTRKNGEIATQLNILTVNCYGYN